jgi:SAM-dependent methyltransferase
MQRFIHLNEWFYSGKGRRLANGISQQLEDILPRCYGVHLLQCGLEEHNNWLSSSQIDNHHILTPFSSHRPHAVVADLTREFLPFESESISVVVLPFCLELLKDRVSFLQEVNRVLTEDGRVLFIGLNPYGLIGLRKHFRLDALGLKKRSELLSMVRLSKLLGETNFSICQTQVFSYTPSLRLNLRVSFFFEQLGKMLWPYPGNFYLLEAKKNPSLSVTPILQYGRFIIGRQ